MGYSLFGKPHILVMNYGLFILISPIFLGLYGYMELILISYIYILDEPHISIYLLISILILIYGSILIFSLSSKRLDYIDWIRPLICDWKINWESYKFPIQSLDLSKMWK